jgi:glutamyl-tRNA synthetase
MKPRVAKITDLPSVGAFFFNSPANYDEQTLAKVKKDANITNILQEVSTGLSQLSVCDVETCDNLLQDIVARLAVGFGKVGLPIRLAITGVGNGPSLHDIIPIIGKDECVKRINAFLANL